MDKQFRGNDSKEVWGYEPDDDIETIRVHVRHLRTKLERSSKAHIYQDSLWKDIA